MTVPDGPPPQVPLQAAYQQTEPLKVASKAKGWIIVVVAIVVGVIALFTFIDLLHGTNQVDCAAQNVDRVIAGEESVDCQE